jgi:hypothetical protein
MHLRTMLRRLAVATTLAATALGGTTLAAAPASAGEIPLPGCYGAGANIYCEPTVEFALPYSVGTTDATIPVCLDTCTDVPVTFPTVTPDATAHVCLNADDRNGVQNLHVCQPLPTVVVTLTGCTAPSSYGVQVRDGNGNVLLDACRSGGVGRPDIRLCLGGPQPGYYIYDPNTGQVLQSNCG